MKLLNAFSVNMLAPGVSNVRFEDMTASEAVAFVDIIGGNAPVSCVGHADTAKLFEAILGVPVPDAGRVSVQLSKGECALLGQYSGPRLELGATTLPKGASIRWVKVNVGF